MKNIKNRLFFFLSLWRNILKIQLVYLFTLALLISTTACLKTRSELENEKSFNLRAINAKKSPDFISQQQQRAQIDSRFYSIDRDFRELYGKIEIIEKQIFQLTSSVKETNQGSPVNSEKIQTMEKQIATLEKALLSIDKKLNELTGEELKKESKQKDTEDITEKANATEKGLKDPLAKAEGFFDKGDFEEAIVQYDKYRKANPKGKEYPKATFKMGLCFQKLKMDEDAKAFYKELIQRYPKNSFAEKARKILKSIKK